MLQFDKDDHKYCLDGFAIPGVNEILSTLGIVDLSGVPEDILAYKSDLGTKVHLATEYLDRGILDDSTVDAAINPYIDAYRAFKSDYGLSVIDIEIMANNDNYAGTIDRICMIGDKKYIIDIKTGGVYRSTRLQTAAYFNLVNECDCRGVVYLKSDGSYQFKKHEDKEDMEIWEKCVDIFHWTKPRYRKKKCQLHLNSEAW